MEELAENDDEKCYLEETASSLSSTLSHDELMCILKRRLKRRRFFQQQMKENEKMEEFLKMVQTNFEPKHPELYQFDNWPIDQKLLKMLESNSFDPEVIHQVNSLGLYTFSIVPESFCHLFVDEIDHIEQWSNENQLKLYRPNSMNKYGVILDHFGFESCLNSLMKEIIEPLTKLLYKHVILPLDSHHGFIVEYVMDKDKKLNFHVDSSSVTLNLCLGTDFTEGTLRFRGVRCQKHVGTSYWRADEEIFLQHTVGIACLHLGKHRHEALPIQSGRRVNLILWCNSSKFNQHEHDNYDECPDWCGHEDESTE